MIFEQNLAHEFLQSRRISFYQEIEKECTDLAALLMQFASFVESKKSTIPLDEFSFEAFWNLYDKKIDKPVCQKKWAKLSQKDKAAIMEYLPKYKAAEPNKKYRKGPEAFLNRRSWENEIIVPETMVQKSKIQQVIESGLSVEQKIKDGTIKFS